MEALVGVLDHYSTQFPDDIPLARWIDDALAGAKCTYSKANAPVRIRAFVIDANTNALDPV